MTAVLFDGFDHGDADHRWTNGLPAQHVTTQVRTGTHSYTISDSSELLYAMNPTEEDDVIYMGFGFYRAAAASGFVTLGFGENFSTTYHVALICRASVRGWEIRRGVNANSFTSGTLIANTLPNVWFPNSWHYIEFAAKIHATTGWAELRQDGVTILRFDGDTDNAGTDQKIDVVHFEDTNAGPYFIDDVYVLNEQGSVNNSWLGDTRCYPLYPNGNGTSSTPLSGSDGNSTDNYLLVDEVGAPVTTDYVFSATEGDQDTYTFQDLPVTLGTIRGVEVRAHAAKDDTGTKQIRMITRRLGTDSFGPDHVLAAIPLWQTHHDIQELDPHAGPGAWTISTINDTEWGVEVRP